MPESSVVRIFVYGTLKTGQVRETMWPHRPIDIHPGTTKAQLHDLGSYPAMTPGDRIVRGEVWRFVSGQMRETLQVLDEIEGYRDAEEDLYKRVVVNCKVGDDIVEAFTYHYARELNERTLIRGADGPCEWPIR